MARLKQKSVFIALMITALLAGFLLKNSISYRQTASKSNTRLPNIIIISLDGLRPDHLGCYGYKGNTSPNIDKFAREGIVFENAFSQSSLPFISYLSLLTSRYPDFFPETRCFAQDGMLSHGEKTLARFLRDNGYFTAMFNSALALSKENGRILGFGEVYNIKFKRLFSQLHHLILRRHDKQLFLMVYCKSCNLPKKWKNKDYGKSDLTPAINSYDKRIRNNDYYLGRLFSMLKAVKLWDNTLLVVTSGYGQELMEHNKFGHQVNLYDTMIRVPLIIKLPKNFQVQTKSVSQLTELIDIMPTVLEVVDVPVEGKIQGRSLLALLQAKEVSGKNMIFSATANAGAVRTTDYKYIFIQKEPSQTEQLYDLKRDPNEKKNLANILSPFLKEKKEMLRAYLFRGRD